MPSNLTGIRLILLVGDTVPLPAPAELMAALQEVQVTNDSEQGDGFQLTVGLSRSVVGDYSILQAGTLDSMKRVILAVLFGVVPEVLIDGIITHRQMNPGATPGQATLTVTGRDLTTLMDLEEKNETYPNQADFLIATQILAGYARHGIVPSPRPTTNFPIMLEHIPRQQETDLQFLRRLAQRNGFVFYLEPITMGVTQAYFGPQNRAGIPQPALSVHLGASSNVRSVQFAEDALAPVGSKGVFVEPFTGMSIPIPALPSLRVPPLAMRSLPAQRTRVERETANQNAATAATTALATATNAPDPVTADGELDSARYGHALRARKLVGVRGAGLTHDGVWYVRSVTHSIRRGSYSQRFRLSREGHGTLTPVLPT